MTKTKHPAKSAALEDIFEEAVEAIPYPDLEPTSITQGDFDADDDDFIEYSAEYTFTAGKLLDEPLEAGGWVELRRDDGEVYISAFFGVARQGNWEDKEARVLPEHHAIQGQCDQANKSWEFWIDAY
ncbi:hypothetical protein ACFLYO_04905 [Chloroflexota bacterium]